MHSAGIETERVTLSPEQRSSIDPIVFEDLPPSEQEIARTAIEGRYWECPTDRDTHEALYSFADRAEEHADENYTAYLKRGDDYYKLFIIIQDMAIVG